MKRTRKRGFPDLATLTSGLALALRKSGCARNGVTVLARRRSRRASTFPTEIVTCRADNGKRLRLYCKYANGYTHACHDPRQGIAYEVEVYRTVLKALRTTTPRFYGSHLDTESKRTWLILEYLEDSVPVSYTPYPVDFLNSAAQWAGRFHSVNEAKLKSHPLPFMVHCGAEYYVGCARRTLLYANDLHKQYPWLRTLCRRYEELVDLLVHPLTVVHGEYEIDNLLMRNGKIYPVDWEAAAIAAGEIDLANLTCDWCPKTIKECEREYCRARWPEGPPPEFERRLGTARLHYCFRWLAGRRDWTTQKSSSGWFSALRAAGEQMGLI